MPRPSGGECARLPCLTGFRRVGPDEAAHIPGPCSILGVLLMVNEGRVVVTDEAWMAGGQLLATDIGSETEVELTVQDEPRLLSCPVALSIVRACGGRLRIPFDLLRRRSDRNLVISAYRRFAQADTVITLRRRRPRQVATP